MSDQGPSRSVQVVGVDEVVQAHWGICALCLKKFMLRMFSGCRPRAGMLPHLQPVWRSIHQKSVSPSPDSIAAAPARQSQMAVSPASAQCLKLRAR